jgi:hypothetical protein
MIVVCNNVINHSLTQEYLFSMQAHPFYDFEEVIDSDEELNLDAMDSGTSSQ